MKEFKLNNGVMIPALGIGTFLLSPAEAEASVTSALEDGYRLIDTANAYVNERAVGRAIAKSNLKRGEIFVSTKLWPSEHENPDAVDETLERLGLEYIDLLFLHQPAGAWRKGYEQLVSAYKAGKIRAVGVSNFEGEYIDALLKGFDVVPQVIQVECHPYFPQTELRKVCDPLDIRIMSWYPLGGKGNTAKLLGEPVITALADKYGKTPAQIALRWHVEMGFIVIPGSKNPRHIRDNADIFDFDLTGEDMAKLSSLDKGRRNYIRTQAALDSFAAWKPQFERE